MSKFIANIPINNVSFGQTSTLFLRTYLENLEEYSKIKELNGIFPIGGNPDLSSQDAHAQEYLMPKIQELQVRAMETHDRKDPAFKLWHLAGSIESFSDETLLLSFYELDQPTKTELNIAKNNKLAFSSKHTCDVFKAHGAETLHIPLAFDEYNFKPTNRSYADDGRIIFNIAGKFENRKNHAKAIPAWYKRFGNDPKYFLQCAIYNGHLVPEVEKQNQIIIQKLMAGQNYFNTNYFGSMLQNSAYNDFLNSAQIIIGMSGGEGWGLPEFQSVALGKHAVILDAHGYRDWANDENSVLVKPSGKRSAVDQYFFFENAPFNQGEIYDFDEDAFIHGCEEAIKRVEANPVNEAGLKLQEEFSKERFTKTILENI